MTGFEVLAAVGLASALMLAGAWLMEKKKPGVTAPGQDERN